MSIIQRTVTVARPFPLTRQVLLPDAYCKSYADALDSMEPNTLLLAGKHFHEELEEDPRSAITVPIALADMVDNFKDIGDNTRARIAYNENAFPMKKEDRLHTRLHWVETSGFYEAIPRFCRLLWVILGKQLNKYSKGRSESLDLTSLEWGSVRHIGHPIIFPEEWNSPSILFEKDLYHDSEGAICMGSILFLPLRKGAPEFWVAVKKNLINLALPGFVNDSTVVARINHLVDGRQVFCFLHRGNDSEEPRCYMHYVGSLVAGTYAILSRDEYTAKYVVS